MCVCVCGLYSQFGSDEHVVKVVEKIANTELGNINPFQMSRVMIHKIFPLSRISDDINVILDDISLGKEVLAHVRSLRANEAGLVELNLSDHDIGEAHARGVAGALLVNTTLTDLTLGRMDSFNDLGEAGAREIASMLLVNTSLKRLSLDQTGLGAAGARELAGAMRVNTTLTDLTISRNDLEEPGFIYVADALRFNTTITALYLHDNNELTENGARSLAGALRVNTTLLHLKLHRIGLGDAGARQIAAALQVNTTLNSLSLGESWRNQNGNWIPDGLGESVKQELREVWGVRGTLIISGIG